MSCRLTQVVAGQLTTRRVKDLVIDVKSSEIVIALLEDKQLIELNREKSNTKFAVGDIYLAKVKKIMAGLNAAFVDVGYSKDAFLHYLDLGAQFKSLDNYVQHARRSKGGEMPPLSSFQLSPDINKNGKITEVLSPGQAILVQIAKEPISTKGPRLSSEISIPGRNLVLMPFGEKVSVSQKIRSADERKRLKRIIVGVKPKNYGVIVRTAAEGKAVAQLENELKSLVAKWEDAFQTLQSKSCPSLVIGELDRTSAILRDVLNASFNNIVVNDQMFYQEIKDYIATIAPERNKIVKLYNRSTPIFDFHGIEKQIKALFGKTVTIKNGAYLIIEHTEALHVIDVNSGNRSRKGSDQETNALDVNLIAADEIARQLRLRDMGGIIVVDFIDMQDNAHKQQVFERMKQAMASDRTKHNILPLSKFGLMQITRQRVRPETNIKTMEVCPTCEGTGEITPSILFEDELENHIQYILSQYKPKQLIITLHPYIAAFLTKGLPSIRMKWQWRYKLRIKIRPSESQHYLEYHFYGDDNEEIIR